MPVATVMNRPANPIESFRFSPFLFPLNTNFSKAMYNLQTFYHTSHPNLLLISATTLTRSNFNALSIGSGPVTAALLCIKRESA